jgi:hypothetical protein
VQNCGAKCALKGVSIDTIGWTENGTPGAAYGNGRCTHERRLCTAASTTALRDMDTVRVPNVGVLFPVVPLEIVLVRLNENDTDDEGGRVCVAADVGLRVGGCECDVLPEADNVRVNELLRVDERDSEFVRVSDFVDVVDHVVDIVSDPLRLTVSGLSDPLLERGGVRVCTWSTVSEAEFDDDRVTEAEVIDGVNVCVAAEQDTEDDVLALHDRRECVATALRDSEECSDTVTLNVWVGEWGAVRDALDNVPDSVRDAVFEFVDDAETVALDLLVDSDTARVGESDTVALLEGETVCVLL